MLIRAIILFVTLAAGVRGAFACLWDSDTLRTEIRGMPNLAEIIVGRFDRFPPRYFEMRYERASATVAANANNWEAYDDACVACDRLGLSDQAVEWGRRKLSALQHAESDNASDHSERREHLYRAYANLGTVLAHRWFKRGADRGQLADIEEAQTWIAKAIELNPSAHFGRERYQLLALRWIADPPTPEGGYATIFAKIVKIKGFQEQTLAAAGFGDAPEGLAGLVALGNAWESVDVFVWLGVALDDAGFASLAYLADLRVAELIDAGRRSLHPTAPASADKLRGWLAYLGRGADNTDDLDAYFKAARQEAESWHQARIKYVLDRLQQGRHPDTDSAFWDEWRDPSSPPQPPNGLHGFNRHSLEFSNVHLILLALLAAIAATSLALIRAIRQRRTATS